MRVSTSPKMEPWVGRHYEIGGFHGIRLLVLGESHHGTPGEEDSTFTQGVVRKLGQLERTKYSRAFTKVATLALGKLSAASMSNEERADFWDRVAFYNFVQSIVPDSRVAPTQSEWEEGEAPFRSVFAQLKPQVILVLGQRLGAQLPQMPTTATVCIINHPSTGFGYARWRPGFVEAMSAAGARLAR